MKEIKVKLGDKVSEGTVVLTIEAVGAAPPAAASAAAAPAPAPAKASAPAPAPAAAPAASGPVEVVVPDIGDFDEVAVIEIFVKPGDSVKVEQSLITVESDKASMEIPSSHAGVIDQVLVKVGDKVSKGKPIVMLAGVAGAAAPASAPAAVPAPAATAAPVAAAAPAAMPAHDPTATASAVASLPHASPTIRRMARELGVPLAEVKGSGPKGRITQEDLQGFVKNVMAGSVQTAAQKAKAPAAAAASGGIPGLLPWPQVDFTKFGAVERKDLSRIKKISGANLHRNWVMIPHVTNNDEADITELEAFRVQLNKENEKIGIKVTMLAFVIKAVVAALKKFPDFNTSLDNDQLVYKQYFHIGFAADTPNGLVVPVLKDADKKGLMQIAQEMTDLSKKARDGKLGPADMTGGCFSISSLGRHRRHALHADHQRAGSRDPGTVEGRDQAGVGRQGLPAAADPSAVLVV